MIYVPSLGNDLTSDEHGSADSKQLPSLLDACLPNYATKIDFEYGPGDVIQGRNSRNAIRDLALKLLFQLQDHKMSWTVNQSGPNVLSFQLISFLRGRGLRSFG